MKKSIIITALLFSIALFAENILHKTLPNGMEVIVKENKSNTSVGFYCFVKTGSIHEQDYSGKGLSHYLEHIVSGGSTVNNTETWHADKRKEIGAMTNAYTIFGATVYHMQADKEFADTSLSLLSDNIINCTFNAEEVTREKDVIVKEFVMRVTSPMAKVRNTMRAHTFLTSNVKNEVIGEIELFKNTTREEMMDYYNRRYMPNNMIFVAVGDLNPEETMKKIEDTFKDYKRGVLTPITQPIEKIRPGNIKYIDEFAIQQPRVYITKLVPSSATKDFAAIKMAGQILFEKRNSPVQYKLVEEEKIVNWVYGYFNEGGYLPETMIQYIFETKDTGNLDKVVSRIDEIISEVAIKGITQKQINEVISREKAQKILNTPTVEADAQEIGWNMMDYGVPEIHDIRMAQYEALTPEEVTEAIKEYYVPKNRVIFYAVPEGQKANLSKENQEIVKTEVEKTVINSDITLLHKQNTTDPIIRGEIFLPISSDYETLENVGSFQFLIDNMFSGGTKDFSSMELTSWMEDHAMSLNAKISPDGVYISFKCIKEDIDEVLNKLYSIMNKPLFDEKELALAKEREDSSYKRSISNPDHSYNEFRSSILYNGQNSGVPAKEKNDIIQNISKDDLKKLYKTYFKAENIIVTFFGDIGKDDAKKYAEKIKDNTPDGNIKGTKMPLFVPKLNDTFVDECEFEQVNVVMNFQAPLQGDPDFYHMTALNQVMANGFSGRLIKATRVTNNLAYSAYSYYSGTKDYGFYRVVSQTSFGKKDELVTVLKHEVQRLIDGDITQEEINLSVESYAKMLDGYFTDDQLVGRMTTYESKGLGYNYLKEQLNYLRKVTPEQIKAVANKYLKDAAIIISQPSADVKRIVE
ncbi:MAG: pitrilysin family protein [Candidatus Delongbacteria bacterium]|jgi:zinc protease|nr:pitrilysin family protein [Candidatus Delongbacteria bacterium]